MNTESISKVISRQEYFLELMGQHKNNSAQVKVQSLSIQSE
jgi:hypothetical protein